VSVLDDYLAAAQRGDTQTLASLNDRISRLDVKDWDSTSLHGVALWYAEQDIAVFPIEARGKRPLTAHGFKDASTDRSEINAWWSAWPDANIGTPTGVAFDVVDVDGPTGIESMYGGESPLFTTLNVIGKALTARDGGQHLFVPPTGRGNGASVLPGIDYRGAGGYVVLPPSIGENGRRYNWLQPLVMSAPVDAA
jgi:hypothetical protein